MHCSVLIGQDLRTLFHCLEDHDQHGLVTVVQRMPLNQHPILSPARLHVRVQIYYDIMCSGKSVTESQARQSPSMVTRIYL